MKTKWLNIVLLLTNRIYSKKQGILGRTGLGIIVDLLNLVFLEILLAIISFPLYIGLRSSGVTAFLEEKGGYVKIAFDYNLRRILTLTGVGLVFLMWAIKLLLIILVPNVYGPLQLYSVSELKPVDILNLELATIETQIETARVVDTMTKPVLTGVDKAKGKDYIFQGTGDPESTVVLMLSDIQTIIYSEKVDKKGRWEIKHSQDDLALSDGNHPVLVYSYDEGQGIRSDVSAEQFFKVQKSGLDKFVENTDVLANWSVVILILMGIFLTFLTI